MTTHDSGLTQLAVTPFFLPYRDDPRFMALRQKLNVHLPQLPRNHEREAFICFRN